MIISRDQWENPQIVSTFPAQLGEAFKFVCKPPVKIHVELGYWGPAIYKDDEAVAHRWRFMSSVLPVEGYHEVNSGIRDDDQRCYEFRYSFPDRITDEELRYSDRCSADTLVVRTDGIVTVNARARYDIYGKNLPNWAVSAWSKFPVRVTCNPKAFVFE